MGYFFTPRHPLSAIATSAALPSISGRAGTIPTVINVTHVVRKASA